MRLFLLTLLTACASSYKPNGLMGGYSDSQIGQNKYLVEFKGNGYTSQVAAREMALKRAKELCQEKGFASFETESLTEQTKVTKNPSSFNCTHNQYSAQCNEEPTRSVERPRTQLIISCSN